MKSKKLRIALSQFPISGDIDKNLGFYLDHIAQAKSKKAEVIAFAETSLSGYGGTDWDKAENVDIKKLRDAEKQVHASLKTSRMWGVYGNSQFNKGMRKPHNVTHVVNPQGKKLKTYSKIFCTTADLNHYDHGKTFTTFKIKDFVCGNLICHDFRYPVMYSEYLKKNVRLMFNTFYQVAKPPYKTALSYIAPIHLKSRAAENCMFVVAPNYAGKHSAWGSMVINPAGIEILKLPRAKAALDVCDIDLREFEKGWGEVRRRNALRSVNGNLTPLTDPQARKLCY